MRVFLSASIPDAKRDPRFHQTADNIAIRECVVALAEVVLRGGELVFGGHPAISPMVARVATYLGQLDAVTIFQSEYFRGQIPSSTLQMPRIHWSVAVKQDRNASLDLMRAEMLDVRRGGASFDVGVFVGGMEGIEAEYDLFRAAQPLAAFWPIPAGGAAAKGRYDRDRDEVLSQSFAKRLQLPVPVLRAEIETSRDYGHLMRTLLGVP
jgi:hypothetical protein